MCPALQYTGYDDLLSIISDYFDINRFLSVSVDLVRDTTALWAANMLNLTMLMSWHPVNTDTFYRPFSQSTS